MELWIFLLLMLFFGLTIVALIYFFLKRQEDQEVIKLQLELRKGRQEFFLPARLEAYQRAILLMERIHPNSLVMRAHQGNVTALAQQGILLKTIREEFDHNVAQQLFISEAGWKMMRDSKEESIRLINLAAAQMGENASSLDLSAKIMELLAQLDVMPSEVAVSFLKQEFQALF
ncbi:MAG: hypothetical protein ACKOXP_10240 [Flavobacteriales bacterium]